MTLSPVGGLGSGGKLTPGGGFESGRNPVPAPPPRVRWRHPRSRPRSRENHLPPAAPPRKKKMIQPPKKWTEQGTHPRNPPTPSRSAPNRARRAPPPDADDDAERRIVAPEGEPPARAAAAAAAARRDIGGGGRCISLGRHDKRKTGGRSTTQETARKAKAKPRGQKGGRTGIRLEEKFLSIPTEVSALRIRPRDVPVGTSLFFEWCGRPAAVSRTREL